MMRRGLFVLGVSGWGAGCLPAPPVCDDGCAQSTEAGTVGSTEGSGDASVGEGTTGTEGPAPDGSDADDDSESDGGSESDDTTGEPPAHCPTISALYADEVDGHEVGNCSFDLGFAEDESFTLSRITLHGGINDNLLMSEPREVAGLERLSGIIQWPDVASWNGLDPGGSGATVLQSGPAVFRILVEWHDGPVGNADITGRSFYTVIADGRIMRDQFVHLTNTGTIDPAWLVDYTALRADYFSTVEWGGDESDAYDVTSAAGDVRPDYFYQGEESDVWLCAYSASNHDVVGVAPYRPSENIELVGARASRSDLDPGDPATLTDSVALQADWHRDDAITNGFRYASAMMFVEARTENFCDGVAEQYAAYSEATLVTPATGATVMINVIGDDDGDGYSEGGGFYAFDASGSEGTIALEVGDGPDIPTALFLLAGISTADVASVLVGGRELGDEDYLVQDAAPEAHADLVPVEPDLPGGLFLLLGDTVESGDVVTIELR